MVKNSTYNLFDSVTELNFLSDRAQVKIIQLFFGSPCFMFPWSGENTFVCLPFLSNSPYGTYGFT